MSITAGSAASALVAGGRWLDNSARNLANAQTDGYKRLRTDLVETPPRGVAAATSRDDTPGPVAVDARGSARELSNVDTATEMVDLAVASLYFSANVKALKAEDETARAALDIMA